MGEVYRAAQPTGLFGYSETVDVFFGGSEKQKNELSETSFPHTLSGGSIGCSFLNIFPDL